ncbi:MAG: hypothetical protein LKF30_04495 [Sphingobium sp.]|jgi:predicted small lipoprotein YifL|nr:hypothetical protein [Sphingobium sp.]MCI1271888.1 hypothetical protein [Sphingobium sp.]MCI2051892.1 hypothetical protein [Sphingobium sp.]
MRQSIALALALLALAGCGSRKDLSLKPGQTPPPVGRGADHVEAPGELTRFEKQARPDRAGEPLYRSEERKDDKFDLPPS